MKILNNIKKAGSLLLIGAVFCTACNKLELDPTPNVQPEQSTTPTLATLLDDPNFSFLKAAVKKAGLLTTLGVPTQRFTVFAPDNDAFTRSAATVGLTPAQLIGALDTPTIRSIVSYHVVPQLIGSASISAGFPNFEYPTILNPTTGKASFNPLVRLSTFPSKRPGGAWVNNIPITATDIMAVNGVAHKVYAVILPPAFFLWDTLPSTPPLNVNHSIFSEPDLTYLKAAVTRADSGVAAGSRLVDALTNFGANLTVFAPTDAAMKQFLTASIYRALLARVVPQPPTALDSAVALGTATFAVNTFGLEIISDPYNLLPPPYNVLLAKALTPTAVRGIVAYHIVSKQSGNYAPPGIRIFSVNAPIVATPLKTLLSPAAPLFVTDPDIIVKATFAPGLPFVGAMTVKGVSNATASNVIINAAPPFVHDLHFINGVMHKIDQVLVPPPQR